MSRMRDSELTREVHSLLSGPGWEVSCLLGMLWSSVCLGGGPVVIPRQMELDFTVLELRESLPRPTRRPGSLGTEPGCRQEQREVLGARRCCLYPVASLRCLVPQEQLQALGTGMRGPYSGCFRWFPDPNVIRVDALRRASKGRSSSGLC